MTTSQYGQMRRSIRIWQRAESVTGGKPLQFECAPPVRWPRAAALAAILSGLAGPSPAQVALTDSGMPTYSYPISVPPGIGGMEPRLSLVYTGGVNGPVGQGWSLQGISSITRCPPTKTVDGKDGAVAYGNNDKLCLDGQRLIQTDANGVVRPFPQTGDAAALNGTDAREYRTEKDGYSRIRAYGAASVGGPQYFKVWAKSGQVYEYGGSPSAIARSANSLITLTTISGAPSVWAVARITDVAGNYMDFSYLFRAVDWGASFITGTEWNIARISYSGKSGYQEPTNSLTFNYEDRPDASGDRSEAIHLMSKKLSIRRLTSILSTLEPSQLMVRTTKLAYGSGLVTGRSVLQSITECAGVYTTNCSPATRFSYTPGGNSFALNTSFGRDPSGAANGLETLPMVLRSGWGMGVITGDFNGDGRTDILRWSGVAAENVLYLSSGNGNFTAVPAGSGAGQFNIADALLFQGVDLIDQCFQTIAADFNGDGLTDLFRFASPGARAHEEDSVAFPCAAGQQTYLFLSSGDGSFSRSTVRDAGDNSPIILGRSPGIRSDDGIRRRNYANFMVADLNGDGILDIFSMYADDGRLLAGSTVPGLWCTTGSQTCGVTVWFGRGDGSFTRQVPAYFTPGGVSMPAWMAGYTGRWSPYSSPNGLSAQAVDLDGDGLPELLFPALVGLGQSGDAITVAAEFSLSGPGTGAYGRTSFYAGCFSSPAYADLNGDGKVDVICDGMVPIGIGMGVGSNYYGGFARTSTYDIPFLAEPPISLWVDFDGDGRTDLVWPANNVIYRSLGNGRFAAMSAPSLVAMNLMGNNYSYARFQVGNFAGSGALEFLRFTDTPTTTPNKLYTKVDPLPPDLLATVTSGTGLVSSVTYANLTNTPRYASDRSTANAAVYPNLDLTASMVVATTLTVDSGVGAGKNITEFGFRGLKADRTGRGALGFREVRQQNDSPDGVSKLTTVKQNLQVWPYVGSVAVSETYLASLSVMSSPQAGQRLGRSENVYCDLTAAAGEEALATASTPCPVTSKVQRPYVRKSTRTGVDLAGNALPAASSITTYTGGYPTLVLTTTVGGGPAGEQSFSQRAATEYWPDNIAGDYWILGLPKKTTVTSTVPNVLPLITTSAGTSPKAAATSGP